jgi:hypothetical protein
MVFLLVTAGVSGLAIFLVASLLEWTIKKVSPGAVTNLSHVAVTLAVVSVTTAVYVFVMTRPSIVGPYEQWTFENIGGQVIGGMLAAGLKIWLGGAEES